MENSYFLFSLNHHLAAIKTACVEEIFFLPELIRIPEAPLGIVGGIDVRGDALPILDLQLSVESQPQRYKLTDSIIVLKQTHLRVGIIVNAVHGLREISSQEITAVFFDDQDWIRSDAKKFFAGMVAKEENIFILSDLKDWFKPGEIQQIMSVSSVLERDQLPEKETLTCATSEEQVIFHQRAENLRQLLDKSQYTEGLKTLVVIVLNNRLFGIDSQIVREFITIHQATPIPCCPTYVIGNINLRGEMLTVFDIREALNLLLENISRTPKAVVIEFENTVVGVVVEEIRNAMFSINPHDIKEISDTDSSIKRKYVQKTVLYDDQMIHILDLPTLLCSDELVVDEVI